MGVIVCSVKDACKLIEHMNENDMIILSVMDGKRYLHDVPKRIRKKCGEELIEQAEDILYQNNDFFWSFVTIRNNERQWCYSQSFISSIGIKRNACSEIPIDKTEQTFYNWKYQMKNERPYQSCNRCWHTSDWKGLRSSPKFYLHRLNLKTQLKAMLFDYYYIYFGISQVI